MANPMFYKEPVPLQKEEHRSLKLGPFKDFQFAHETNSVQIVGIEFYEVAKEYPIVFVKLGNGSLVPCALRGLEDTQNRYLDKDNEWDARYVPSYVRRYPFILTEPDEKGVQTVFVDKACDRLQDKEGDAFFNEDGTEGAVLDSAKAFMLQHYGHSRMTLDFTDLLVKEELLTEMAAKFEVAGGKQFLFDHLFVINEQKLMQLPQKKVYDLFSKGWLGWVYAHLMSLSNMSMLVDRYVEKESA